MKRKIQYFIDGYGQSLNLIPNYDKNNIGNDWKMVGLDLYRAINKLNEEIKGSVICEKNQAQVKSRKSRLQRKKK
jgi:hypothetical protein